MSITPNLTMLRRKIVGVFLLYAFLLPTLTFGQTATKIYEAPKETLDKIDRKSVV